MGNLFSLFPMDHELDSPGEILSQDRQQAEGGKASPMDGRLMKVDRPSERKIKGRRAEGWQKEEKGL